MPNELLKINIRKLRLEAGLSQKELAEELTQRGRNEGLGDDFRVPPVNVSKWEAIGAVPRNNVLNLLARYFNTTPAFILGETADIGSFVETDKVKYGDYKEIDIPNISRYGGLPVWVETDENGRRGRYALVDGVNERLIFSDGTAVSVREVKGTVKAGPSPFTVSFLNLEEKPLSLADAMSQKKVWVEMIGAPDSVSEKYRGWYTPDKKHGAFIAANGLPLPADEYMIGFIAFKKHV